MQVDIESELKNIHDRNRRVEADKAWETSFARRGFISAATYVVAAVWLIAIHDTHPLLKALVPVAGFILSTLSLPFLKRAWITEFLVSTVSPRVANEQVQVRTSPVPSGSATERLGHTVVEGVVVEGKGEGSKLGFPTINVGIRGSNLESGIFAGKVHLPPRVLHIEPQSYFAALYVPEHKEVIEAHLLDFADDLYGVHVKIEIFGKIRDVVNFASDDDAKLTIEKDIKAVEKIFFGGPDF